MWQSKMSGLGRKVIGQLDLWCLYKTSLIQFNISLKYYDFHLNSYRKMNYALRIKLGLAVKMVKVNPDSSFVHTW